MSPFWKHSPPARRPATEHAYRKRAEQLWSRFLRECPGAGDFEAFLQWLEGLVATLAPSSRRQYCAALAWYLDEELGRPELANRIRAIKVRSSTTRRRTSRQRLRHLSAKDLKSLARAMLDQNGNFRRSGDPLILAWLIAGRATGLRPCEWWGARLKGDVLEVRNAKATNGRGNGTHRYLSLRDLEDLEKQVVRYMVEYARANPGTYPQEYRRCADRLRSLTRRLWPRRKRWPTLYSARHQFRANAARAGLPKAIQAALMGHGSTITASRHYGRPRYGEGPCKARVAHGTRIPAPRRFPAARQHDDLAPRP